MTSKSDKYVRFYFGLSVSCLIPENPREKRDNISEVSWEESYLERISDDLKSKLSEDGYEIAYRKHAPIDAKSRLYAAQFVVSILHPFSISEIIASKANSSKFAVKKRSFLKTKASLQTKIKNALRRDFVVNEIAYEYAASRTFQFKIYLAGTLALKHIISAEEISEWGGKIRAAIENFNTQVIEHLAFVGCDADPKTAHRRPKDNIYIFDLSATVVYGFNENEVFGSLVRLEPGMAHNEALYLGIDCDDDVLHGCITSKRDEVEWHCSDCAPYDSEISYFSLEFIDYDEDFLSYDDELIQR